MNVGGHRTFRPSQIVRGLADLDVVNVGAAGTFVVRGSATAAAVRAAFRAALPFQTEVITCSGRALLALAASEPFPGAPPRGDVRRFLSVMAKRPARVPEPPLRFPTGAPWQISLVRFAGVFACGYWRRLGDTFVDPNSVIEKAFGVRSTARNWNTVEKVCAVLQRP